MTRVMNLIVLGLCTLLAASVAYADATVNVCGKDEWPGDPRTDLKEALQIGGRITFACSGVIEFTTSHGLTNDVQMDGGDKITLDGKGHRMFGFGSSGAHISFSHITIQGAGIAPGTNPGSVISGEGYVSFLDGARVQNSDRPVWLLGGDAEVRNATFAQNAGPVLIVSAGMLTIAMNSRFTDNTGELLATGPATNVRISDSQFSRNGHSDFGGTEAAGCEVVITGSSFSSNADTENGGALRSRCKLTVEETQFDANRSSGNGGAIYITRGANASMRKVRFSANQAGGSGGAVAGQWDLNLRGGMRIRYSRFEGNTATLAGGALFAGESSGVEIGGSGFVGNVAGTAGGAVYIRQSLLSTTGSLFRKNQAHSGGAIQALCMPPMGRIANSIIADNTSATTGAAYFGGNMHFLNATIVNNGGVPVHHGELCGAPATIEFANSIVQGGLTGACGGADAQRTFKDLGHNLQFPQQTCGTTIPAAYPLLGPFFAPVRPLSPAGSAGDNSLCLAPPINGRDFFGTHRPQGDVCSIGAVEGDLTQLFDRWWKRGHRRFGLTI